MGAEIAGRLRPMRAPFRVVVITGASSGLGAALARAYAAPGATLGLVGRDRARLDGTARACAANGARVRTAVLDVADAPAMAAWLRAFDDDSPVELLIANAGTSAGPPPESPSEGVETAARQIATNLLGAVHTIEPLLPALCARRRGRVAAVASIAAYRGLPYSPGYCASKAGLRAYAEALRARLEPFGVGVTVICPGFFASPMTDRFEGPTPFLVAGESAARIVKRGIDRGRRRVAFPWPLVRGLQFCDLAPAAIGDAILRRFHFRIRPA
jgi:short-subunit dehydrogenase